MSATDRNRIAEDQGVVFPRAIDGRRASSAVCQSVFVEALAAGSAESAARASIERHWRAGYAGHVRELVRLSLARPDTAVSMARAGLAALHGRLEFVRGAASVPVGRFEEVVPERPFESVELKGRGASTPQTLAIPYRGDLLTGSRLDRQLDRWQEAGIVETSHVMAIREVASHPEWLDLSDRCFVLLGASAEIGPLAWLARWRARIAAIDLPGKRTWERIARCVHEGNATLIAPTRAATGTGPTANTGKRADGVLGAATYDFDRTGADLLTDLPELLQWVSGLDGPLAVGAYAYLDGATHLRVSAAMDALMASLCARRDDVALALLATPTDVYAVPGDAVRESRARYGSRGLGERAWQRAIATATGKRFFQPNYPAAPATGWHARHGVPVTDAAALAGDGATAANTAGICDSLVLQQGPNYALAKRLQQWRALVAREDGVRASINVAPSTTTHSVVKNPALAAAFAGAHHFGVESFDASTTSALMAALLVYDLRSERSPANPSIPLEHPLDLLAHGANHGGMWRMPFVARSALPVAAALGWTRRMRAA